MSVNPKFGDVYRKKKVHTLIAETFHPEQKEEKQKSLHGTNLILHVDHIDGNKSNNASYNLQWLTPAEHGKKTANSLSRSRPPNTRTIHLIAKNHKTGEECAIPGIAACRKLLRIGHKRVVDALGGASVACPDGWELQRHPASIQPLKGEHFQTIYFALESEGSGRVSRTLSLERPNGEANVPWLDVSNLGRIRFPGTSVRITWGTVTSDRYRVVQFRRRDFRVHRLVAEAHRQSEKRALIDSGAKEEFLHVDHMDGDPRNNAVENLQWLTPSAHRKETWRRMKSKLKGGEPL
uniref:HNH nuclease domain-containing protein n=1 Tax=Chromera velia CCMP2878 TaxID=1169474 RepID=A0A0G4F6W7_9ALVE|eukprot:Cvel_15435.t1-p1 / transcript=Cvel_15435.t1 / gene=Cvel_15435 / organism=Chromera_velia_CCMP2878 / gene_product=hypothetical protein / transcript_product=hypothetical protein / location=Cvel_scaffold1141:38710-39585(-) / protein_length=292 / sequence_SO=supercontig / SO=protein_coding / is_pseudo=false